MKTRDEWRREQLKQSGFTDMKEARAELRRLIENATSDEQLRWMADVFYALNLTHDMTPDHARALDLTGWMIVRKPGFQSLAAEDKWPWYQSKDSGSKWLCDYPAPSWCEIIIDNSASRPSLRVIDGGR